MAKRIHDSTATDVETGSGGSGSSPLLTTDGSVHVLSDGTKPLDIMGVGASLSMRAKLVFLATNFAYFLVAVRIALADSVPTRWPTCRDAPKCASGLCTSSAFHSSIVLLMAFVSTFWHGAQCQLASWLYCNAALHSPVWLKRLVVGDVLCCLSLVVIGCVCFGPLRTFSWIVPSFLLTFVMGRRAKKRRQYHVYAFWHGVWHIFSALSIWQIVLNSKPLGLEWVV